MDEMNVSQSVSPSVESVAAPQATAAPVEAVQTTVSAEQLQPAFLDSLSEDLRSAKSLGNFKDVNELAKSYLNAQALIGKRISEMGVEDLQHINHLRGVPEAADKYALPAELEPQALDWYRNAALEAGLSQEQARKLSESYIMNNRQALEQQQQQVQLQHTNWINSLKQEFGSAFDQRVDVAKRAVDAFGGSELKQLLNETGLGNHPTIVKMFANIGANILEDRLVNADYEKSVGVTPDDAKNKVNLKLSDPEFRKAYYSQMHPGHKSAVDEITALFAAMGSSNR
jgi:hypothetical protein